ncbi:MAG: cell division topological specificity factor MinE [Lachnospiraceae bacterium]|nr:cell division topological specificity factor MinE [Lachnospiraceae bacterium]MBR3807126.1 cell division topological specificity factor MinE [Lachnospiraceae bacterium]MBR4061183.1 cell division topological specificity factor MinE [Lachnospiraceae bacterium]
MKVKNIFKRKSSKEIAKDRLKILLISDRVNCSAETLEMIKHDIAKVISKYMKIDANSMEIQISKTGSREKGNLNPVLNANIPILDMNK